MILSLSNKKVAAKWERIGKLSQIRAKIILFLKSSVFVVRMAYISKSKKDSKFTVKCVSVESTSQKTFCFYAI